MTQEEEDLLIKDLCSRLPYGVFVKDIYNGHYGRMYKISQGRVYYVSKENCNHLDEQPLYIKPYLRSMSNMTRKEADEYMLFSQFSEPADVVDWLNEHHFDYRGLIGKGLVLEAPVGMY